MKPYYADDLVTLWHGDSREIQHWLSADVLCFDPPYGIGWKKGTNRKAKSYAHAGIQNDSDTAVRDDLLAMWADRGPSATFGSWRADFPPHKQILVWRKPVDAGVVGSTTGFRLDTELIFLNGWPTNPPSMSSVLTTDGGKNAYLTEHPHSKPVPLMQTILSLTTGTVADPTAGSGATVVAAQQLGRRVIAVELDERYCELIAKRVSQQAFDFAGLS